MQNPAETGDIPVRRAREWKANSNERLTGHEQYLAACRWKGVLHQSDGNLLRFWCESFETLRGNTIELHSVIVDTSERIDGVAIVTRLTWYECVVACNCRTLFFPFEPSGLVPTETHEVVTTAAASVP
jgi:hypothetical protein